MAVAEVHVDVADFHLGARDLRSEADGHTLIGLHTNNDGVLACLQVFAFAEETVGGLLEDHRDFGDAAAQALTGAQVEGGAFPTAVCDGDLQRRKSFGAGVCRDVIFVEEAVDVFSALVACSILAEREGVRQIVNAECFEDLSFFGAQVLGIEAEGLFHSGEGEQLQQMVLDDVAGCTHAVVVACAGADADVFGHGDLDVVNVVRVPERFKHLVGETHCQDVLHGFLAEVVVDAEHCVGREDCLHDGVQFACAFKVVTEGLFDDHAAPTVDGVDGVVIAGCEVVFSELGENLLECLWGNRQVECVVAVGTTLIEFCEGALELFIGCVVVEGTFNESHALLELVPHILTEGGAGVCLNRFTHVGAEVVIAPGTAAEADEAEARGEQTAVH